MTLSNTTIGNYYYMAYSKMISLPAREDQERNWMKFQNVPQARKSLVKGERFIRYVWRTWIHSTHANRSDYKLPTQ